MSLKSVGKALEYKVGPYGLLFSWYTLSIRSFWRGRNWKLWHQTNRWRHFFAYLRTGETSGINSWVKLRMKNEKWNGIDGIWTQVCPVSVQTANHYTKGDWCVMLWILIKLIFVMNRGKKSGPSRVARDQALGWALGCTFLSRFLSVTLSHFLLQTLFWMNVAESIKSGHYHATWNLNETLKEIPNKTNVICSSYGRNWIVQFHSSVYGAFRGHSHWLPLKSSLLSFSQW